MQEGLVVKGYGGFYFVQTEEQIYRCRGRGRLHRVERTLLPGDRVRLSSLDEENGVIEEVLPRSNVLLRPPVANVEQVIIVISLVNPIPDLFLLDRLLVLAGVERLETVICFNKLDLAKGDRAEQLVGSYRLAGYQVVVTSAKEQLGLETLRQLLKGKISVVSGPSGTGKSTLLNALDPSLVLQTGEISQKLQRGKHTTRYVQLLPVAAGYVADTPGFSNLDLPPMKRGALASYFPEMVNLVGQCRFDDCIHQNEPDCEVKSALAQGNINPGRYQHYLKFLAEVIAKERIY